LIEITYEDENITLHAVTMRATVETGLRRQQYVFEGFAAQESDTLRQQAHTWLYPLCMAATSSFEASPPFVKDGEKFISFGDFFGLPEQFVTDWIEAIYADNPHWLPKLPIEDRDAEAKKKRRRSR
jgi:hypothetical protein